MLSKIIVKATCDAAIAHQGVYDLLKHICRWFPWVIAPGLQDDFTKTVSL